MSAVLQLKYGYDGVPKDKPIRMCSQKLAPNMVAIITHIVQSLKVKTTGGNVAKIVAIRKEVAKSRPCSAILFCMYVVEFRGSFTVTSGNLGV